MQPIVVEESYPVPPERVWLAITDPGEMRRWFFQTIADFRPELGFATEFVVRAGERDYPHAWRVTDVVPGRRIVYDWRHPGIPGAAVVEWDLAETPGGSKLTLTHRGLESFPQDDPAFHRETGVAGWRYFLCERLPEYLGR